MQRHLNTPADPIAQIPLENVPHLYDGRRAALRLNIIVVGAGLGGLAAAYTLAQGGHSVTVVESARELRDVGAGIQISPNATRLLRRWGLGPALEACAVEPAAIVFRRYDTGERVGYTRWGERMASDHGAPYYHVHRADYQAVLLRLARAAGVPICLRSTVRDVQPDPAVAGGPSVTLAGGEVLYADLIVGADGVKSTLRKAVTGSDDSPTPTGDAAYHAVLPTDLMLKDPALRRLVETPEMTVWMAPDRHLMAFCIRETKEYNLALFHPDDGSVESWTEKGSADKMRDDFANFEPRVKKLLSLVKSTPKKWRLMGHKPLSTWVHPRSRLVLLGDACHPMLPYRGQGGAIAMEDAAVLGALMSYISSLAQLPTLLEAYQELRIPRATATQESSRLNQRIFHLPHGPEQDARDGAMRAAMGAEREGKPIPDGNPNQWADRTKNRTLFDYDAYAQVKQWWTAEGGQRRIEALAVDEPDEHYHPPHAPSPWLSSFSADWSFKPTAFIPAIALSAITAAIYTFTI